MSLIAETAVVFVFADGRSVRGRIGVGAPYQVAEDEFRCEVVLDGLEPKLSPIAGGSSLQALTLALRFAAKLLVAFVNRGGRILIDDPGAEEDFPLDAYFGGLAADVPPPARPKSAQEVAEALSEGMNHVVQLAEGLVAKDGREPHRDALAATDAALVRLLDANVAADAIHAARAALATLGKALGTAGEKAAAVTSQEAMLTLFDALGRARVYLG